MSNILHINRTTGGITLAQETATALLSLDGSNVLTSTNSLPSISPTFGSVTADPAGAGNKITIGPTNTEAVASYSWKDAGNTNNGFDFFRARGTSGSETAVGDGDWATKWRMYGYNGSSYDQYGGFLYNLYDVSETYGKFVFYVYSGGANYIAEFGPEYSRIGDADGTDYIQVSSTTGDLSFAGSAAFLPPRVSQSAEPTPDSGALLVWRDTDDDKTYLVYNDPDVGVRKVEMT